MNTGAMHRVVAECQRQAAQSCEVQTWALGAGRCSELAFLSQVTFLLHSLLPKRCSHAFIFWKAQGADANIFLDFWHSFLICPVVCNWVWCLCHLWLAQRQRSPWPCLSPMGPWSKWLKSDCHLRTSEIVFSLNTTDRSRAIPNLPRKGLDWAVLVTSQPRPSFWGSEGPVLLVLVVGVPVSSCSSSQSHWEPRPH